MLSNITSNSSETTTYQTADLKSGQKVYLYGDIEYTGRLMRAIERTYPPKWSVALDRGGYEAVNTRNISPVTDREVEGKSSEEELLPSAEDSELIERLERQITILKNTVAQLEKEKEIINDKYRELTAENAKLKAELQESKQTIRYAKDISPIMRPSLQRVLRLAHNACMDVKRTVGGWILKMGDKARRFRRLTDIWDILSRDNWYLGELFAPDQLIPLDEIKPPRLRKSQTKVILSLTNFWDRKNSKVNEQGRYRYVN